MIVLMKMRIAEVKFQGRSAEKKWHPPSEKKKSGLIAQAGWTYVLYVRSGGTLRLLCGVLSIRRTSFTRFAG